MKRFDYTNTVATAIAACPEEAQALRKETEALAALQSEHDRIESAIREAYRIETKPVYEKRLVHGVEIEVAVTDGGNDRYLLRKAAERVEHRITHTQRLRDQAARRLSHAVAAKLEKQQRQLRQRTFEALEALTAVCADGEALEDAFRDAGLDPESVYAARFPELQQLRVDLQWSRGRNIAARLEVA